MQTFAKNFLNDSFRLNICLFYEPVILALSAIYNTSVILKLEMNENWISEFAEGIDKNTILEVSEKI